VDLEGHALSWPFR